MNYQHTHDTPRKDKRRFLRLKIITNRDFNFITAIRPDSTVTDLANRALNAYLQLSKQYQKFSSQENKKQNKKQLTVSAVKQGRYFMPKSEIVSNLLSQDEQVQIIIVKAKPKFPEQSIPIQHDFQILNKKVRNFDQIINKRASINHSIAQSSNLLGYNSQALKAQDLMNKQIPGHISQISQENVSSDLSRQSQNVGQRQENSNLSSLSSSQLQHSKRQRKKQKRKLKFEEKKNKQINYQNNQNSGSQIKNLQSISNEQFQKSLGMKKKNYESEIIDLEQNISENKDIRKQLHLSLCAQGNQKSESLSLAYNNSVDRVSELKIDTKQKSNQKWKPKSKERENNQNITARRDFNQILTGSQKARTMNQMNSEQKIGQQQTKKKVKHDNNLPSIMSKGSTDIVQGLQRKGSVDNRSQKTPKINSVQSPKVVFHFETKHESPKVIYIPQSRTMNEMKESIEREKQKIKIMSPMILPKSSPKIGYLQQRQLIRDEIANKSYTMINSSKKGSKDPANVSDNKDKGDKKLNSIADNNNKLSQKQQQKQKQRQKQRQRQRQSQRQIQNQRQIQRDDQQRLRSRKKREKQYHHQSINNPSLTSNHMATKSLMQPQVIEQQQSEQQKEKQKEKEKQNKKQKTILSNINQKAQLKSKAGKNNINQRLQRPLRSQRSQYSRNQSQQSQAAGGLHRLQTPLSQPSHPSRQSGYSRDSRDSRDSNGGESNQLSNSRNNSNSSSASGLNNNQRLNNNQKHNNTNINKSNNLTNANSNATNPNSRLKDIEPMQPEIIEEQSSSQSQQNNQNRRNGQNNSSLRYSSGASSSQSNQVNGLNNPRRAVSSTTSAKFRQIQSMINKFKLQESSEDQNQDEQEV